MSRIAANPEPAGGLNQVERIVDTFVAPSKTFTDILRSANWILPFLLMLVVTLANSYVIDKQVGYQRIAETFVEQSPSLQDRLSQLTPEERAAQISKIANSNRYAAYGSGAIILIFSLLQALLLWATFKFGLGSAITYGQTLAVGMFAALPKLFTGLLCIAILLFGNNQENFDLKNPVGTNPAFYMPDAALWLKTALSWVDVIGFWSLALLVLGMAIVARKSIAQSAALVVGWWLMGLLLILGTTVAFN